MGSEIANNAVIGDARHAGELRARNRRVGLIVLAVALLLALATVAYVAWFGGANLGTLPELHSALGAVHRGACA